MTTLRPLLATIGVAVLSASLLSGSPALAADEDLPGWTFQENVDLSDESRWTLETGRASNTSSYDTPDNVSFDSSGLTIRGKSEKRPSAAYSSGDAKGLGISIPNYSRVEAVGSVPFGPGLWPALLWLRPLNSPDGEIDLMEVFGDDARVAATIHNEYGPMHRSKQGSVRWDALPNSDPTGTHTYVMEKTPDRIVISVDGHVMLDAGPDDVREGFDWGAVFERPDTTWYPRVTLQIGCPPDEADCGIGVPKKSWAGASMRLESLKIWAMAEPGDPAPPAENGAFALSTGEEARHDFADSQPVGSNAAVTFDVPRDLASGVLYNSLQIMSSSDGANGYRATVALSANGSLRLTISQVSEGRSVVLRHAAVAPRRPRSPGDQVRVNLAYDNGSVLAKAWQTDDVEPAWQLTAPVASQENDGAVYILGYLSRRAPNDVTAGWSDLHADGGR